MLMHDSWTKTDCSRSPEFTQKLQHAFDSVYNWQLHMFDLRNFIVGFHYGMQHASSGMHLFIIKTRQFYNESFLSAQKTRGRFYFILQCFFFQNTADLVNMITVVIVICFLGGVFCSPLDQNSVKCNLYISYKKDILSFLFKKW